MRKAVSAIGIGLAISLLTASPAEAAFFKKKPKITRNTPISGPVTSSASRHPDRPALCFSQAGDRQRQGRAEARRGNLENGQPVARRVCPNGTGRAPAACQCPLAGRHCRAQSQCRGHAAQPGQSDIGAGATAATGSKLQQCAGRDAVDRCRVRQLRNFQRQAFNAIGYAASLSPRAARAGRPNAAAAPKIAVNKVIFNGAARVNQSGRPRLARGRCRTSSRSTALSQTSAPRARAAARHRLWSRTVTSPWELRRSGEHNRTSRKEQVMSRRLSISATLSAIVLSVAVAPSADARNQDRSRLIPPALPRSPGRSIRPQRIFA